MCVLGCIRRADGGWSRTDRERRKPWTVDRRFAQVANSPKAGRGTKGPLMADGMLDDALRGVIRDEMAPLTEQVRLLTEQVTTLAQVIGVGFAAMREDNAELR